MRGKKRKRQRGKRKSRHLFSTCCSKEGPIINQKTFKNEAQTLRNRFRNLTFWYPKRWLKKKTKKSAAGGCDPLFLSSFVELFFRKSASGGYEFVDQFPEGTFRDSGTVFKRILGGVGAVFSPTFWKRRFYGNWRPAYTGSTFLKVQACNI